MKTYIIILHYGKLEVTQKCIDSLAEHDTSFEKIVLLNNDRNITLSLSQFRSVNKKLHIINNKENFGFAAGVNIGIRFSLQKNADYIFLLNNDTMIEKDFLKKLFDVFQKDSRIGIIGPAISFHRNGKTIYDVGGKLNSFFGRTSHKEIEEIVDLQPKIVQYVK